MEQKMAGLSWSAICTAAAAFFHGAPMLLILFAVAMALDYLTGWVKAAYFLHDWNSKTGVRGAIKKAMYVVLIGVSFLASHGIVTIGQFIGWDLSWAYWLGWYMVAVLLINEITSILENLYVIMPDKIPIWLVKSLQVVDDKLDNTINGIVCKNQNCDECDLKTRCNHYKSQNN